MMRSAVIDPKTSVVLTVILSDGAFQDPVNLIVPSDIAEPGWAYDGAAKTFSPPPPPVEPVPEEVSDRQFFEELANEGAISEAEALAYVAAGVIPKTLNDAIAELPAAIQFTARMQVIGANNFYRSAPIAETIGQLLGKSGADLDDLWRRAAKL